MAPSLFWGFKDILESDKKIRTEEKPIGDLRMWSSIWRMKTAPSLLNFFENVQESKKEIEEND